MVRPAQGGSEGSGALSPKTETNTEGEGKSKKERNSPEEGKRSKRTRGSESDSLESGGREQPSHNHLQFKERG